jgi:hypothetical protein
MDGSDFQDLLDEFPVTVVWLQAFLCPCTLDTGLADRTCTICLGRAKYYGDMSEPFRVSITNQNAKERAAMAQTFGPGEMGDATLHLFAGAPCYGVIKSGDQIWDTTRIEQRQIIIRPGTHYRLPPLYTCLTAMVKDGNVLVRAAAPVPDVERRVTVTVATRLTFDCPRGYDVVLDLPKVRTFGDSLPKVFGLRLADMSVR